MKASTWLRAASVVTALLCAGHTVGRPWAPDHSAQGAALVGEMKSYHFDVMGFSRSYWDFYQGFGLTISVSLLFLAVLLWQLASAAKARPGEARPLIAALCATFLAFGVLDWLYFFAAPLVLTLPVVACLALAWGSAREAAG